MRAFQLKKIYTINVAHILMILFCTSLPLLFHCEILFCALQHNTNCAQEAVLRRMFPEHVAESLLRGEKVVRVCVERGGGEDG